MESPDKPGYRALRRGRVSQENARYFITLCTYRRLPALGCEGIPELIFEQLLSFEESFELVASVVMPDHLHAVLRLNGLDLSSSIRLFKGRSARELNKKLGSTSTFWQKGFYDHKFRSDEDLSPILHYLWNNPDIPGTHFRCNRKDWLWFKSTVTNDVDYPSWLREHPLG